MSNQNSRSEKRTNDKSDFNPLPSYINKKDWKFNGFDTYIQSVRVCDKNGESVKEFGNFYDACQKAEEIFNQWYDLREREDDHEIFLSGKWSKDKPPVGGVIRNKKSYAVRQSSESRPMSKAPPCAVRREEGKGSWSFKKSIRWNNMECWEFNGKSYLVDKTDKVYEKIDQDLSYGRYIGERKDIKRGEANSTIIDSRKRIEFMRSYL